MSDVISRPASGARDGVLSGRSSRPNSLHYRPRSLSAAASAALSQPARFPPGPFRGAASCRRHLLSEGFHAPLLQQARGGRWRMEAGSCGARRQRRLSFARIGAGRRKAPPRHAARRPCPRIARMVGIFGIYAPKPRLQVEVGADQHRASKICGLPRRWRPSRRSRRGKLVRRPRACRIRFGRSGRGSRCAVEKRPCRISPVPLTPHA